MKLLRNLTPTGWAVVASIALIAFVGLGLARPTFLGIQFDPFGMNERKIEILTAQRDTAESDAAARGLEAQGERDQAQRVDTYHHQQITIRDVTSRADTEARSAPDANEPVPADIYARLRRTDRQLCGIAGPGACRPAPAINPGGGD